METLAYYPAVRLSNGAIQFDDKHKVLCLDMKPGLFMDFAELKTDLQIFEFAKKHGQMFGKHEESIAWWRQHIEQMAKAVKSVSVTDRSIDVKDLVALINSHLTEEVAAEFHADGTMAIVPKDLQTAMWIQFGRCWNGKIRIERCVHCQSWFSKTHSEKKFCSGTCRTAAYEANKDEVNRMAKSGKSPKEIAKTLGKDLGLVKKWIKESVT